MNQEIRTVTVHTAPAYPVQIGPQLLSGCGAILRALMPSCRMMLVSDSRVAPLYAETVHRSLSDAGFSVTRFVFPAGETSKTLSTLSDLLEALAAAQLTRSDALIALGGGVTGDLTGFAAAIYLRGIRYVQMPTTLLAAVDSSVGGKTAVDLHAGKNLAGAFWQPAAVLCDTDCLTTLPDDIVADGTAEAIKTGVLSGEALFSRFSSDAFLRRTADELARIIGCCVQYKAGVVERDETERGERKLLNLGHTVGHAIERCSGYAIPHGYAVAAGLAVIARAAARFGWAEPAATEQILRTLAMNRLPTRTGFPAAALSEAALTDKKRSGGGITLVIPKRIGGCVLRTIPVSELPAVIAAGLED